MIYYPVPMHQQKAFADLDIPHNTCTVAEKLCETVLALPMHPYLKDNEIDHVIIAVKSFLA